MQSLFVRPISSKVATPWVLEKHYAKRLPQIKWAFGLFSGEDIIGIVAFGRPAAPMACVGVCGTEYKSSVWELNRLVMSEPHGKNDTSFLVGNALKMLPPGSIVISYADKGVGHVGYIYQATNWVYTGFTKERTDGKMPNGQHARHNTTLKVDLSQRQTRTSKHRYVTFCGDKHVKKTLLASLKWEIVTPYPKGETSKSIEWSPFQDTQGQQSLF